MQEQTIEKSDERIGVQCNVAIHKSKDNTYIKANLYDEKFANFNKNDIVYVLTPNEHQQIMDNQKQLDEYIARINKLELEINDSNIRTLTDENEDLKRQLKNKEKSINTYKTNKVKSDAKIEDLQQQVDKQSKIISNNETIINNLKSRIDELGKELDAISSDESTSNNEDEIAQLKDELETSEKQIQYWKQSFENMIESSDMLANENENYKHQNEKLRMDNNSINETNKLLNENIIALNSNFKETKQQMQSDFEKQENELKETIKKQQSHIDEITEKYQSLLVLQDNVPQKQHYDEINALKDEINDIKVESSKTIEDMNIKHSNEIKDISVAHAHELSELKSKHSEDKAQLFVAYNNNINHHKMKYNELAYEYNDLLNDASTLTKRNTLFNSKHKEIIKNRNPVELEIIDQEKLPQSELEIPMEKYVPKMDEQE